MTRYRALLAVIVGIALVAMPDWLMQKSITALLIGLTASGVYSQVKKREYGSLLNTNASSNDSSSNPQSRNNSAPASSSPAPAQSSNIPPIQSSSNSQTPSSATPGTGPRIRGPQDI